jgi:hypothetical protein
MGILLSGLHKHIQNDNCIIIDSIDNSPFFTIFAVMHSKVRDSAYRYLDIGIDKNSPSCNCLNREPDSIRAVCENGGVLVSPDNQTIFLLSSRGFM